MATYRIKENTLIEIANSIRNVTGKTGDIAVSDMAVAIGDIETGGATLPVLTNEGSAADLMLGKELIDADGSKVTGTFSIDNELNTQDDLIAQIQAVVDGLPEAGGEEPVLQTKTVTPSTSSQNVVPDSGYDGLSKVTVNAIPSTYVKPSATKGATTYTPTTSNQTIATGTYCSGAQTIKGDSNLVAGNIKSGISIFGVSGSYEGSGGSSGGNSGGIETIEIMDTGFPDPGAMIIYIDGTMALQQQAVQKNVSYSIMKNSIFALTSWGGVDFGGIQQIAGNSMCRIFLAVKNQGSNPGGGGYN